MTICQHLTGDVRTEKRTKNVSGKGVVYQNNTLNINLMYSCCLCIFLQQTVRLSLNTNRLARLNNLYIAMRYALQRYSVTVKIIAMPEP